LCDQGKKSGLSQLPDAARRIGPAAAASVDFFGQACGVHQSECITEPFFDDHVTDRRHGMV